jgi:hypothetical protein
MDLLLFYPVFSGGVLPVCPNHSLPYSQSGTDQHVGHRLGRPWGALAAKLLHSGSDRRKIVSGAGAGCEAQFLHTCRDIKEIIGGTVGVACLAWSCGLIDQVLFSQATGAAE